MDLDAARARATALLDNGGDRWQHTRAAVRHAEEIAPVVGPLDREVLLAAVWLHDIGRVDLVRRTGCYAVDAGLFLLAEGWPERLAALVAHHCEARLIAPALGAAKELSRFPREEGPVTDAIVHADMASGPRGERMSLRERLDDIDRRHADDPEPFRQALSSRRTALMAAEHRTEQRLGALRRRHLGV